MFIFFYFFVFYREDIKTADYKKRAIIIYKIIYYIEYNNLLIYFFKNLNIKIYIYS